MNFWKMNGAGNDFIILDGIRKKIEQEKVPELAGKLCERHLSIGADGLMLVLPAEEKTADYRMLFYNADGSLGEMCGNGARCICRYGYENGYAGEIQRVQTTAGPVTGTRIDGRNYRIRLNDPTKLDLHVTASVGEKPLDTAYVELGCPGLPHAVLELPEKYAGAVSRLLHSPVNAGDGALQASEAEKDSELLQELRELGRKLRFAACYPKGANVNFYRLTGKDQLDIITFERGVEDFTYACGTGTGSTALVLSETGKTGNTGIRVNNRGGLLSVDVSEEGLYLTGPTNIVAVGEIRDEEII